jgi:hypothetical protein
MALTVVAGRGARRATRHLNVLHPVLCVVQRVRVGRGPRITGHPRNRGRRPGQLRRRRDGGESRHRFDLAHLWVCCGMSVHGVL